MRFRKISSICAVAFLILCSCKQSYVDELSTQYATFSVDGKGFICQVADNRTGVNYLAEEGIPSGHIKRQHVPVYRRGKCHLVFDARQKDLADRR